MTVQTLAAELGIDIADVGVAVRWLTADEVLDEAALELELRGIFDPAGQRTARDRAACPGLRQAAGSAPRAAGLASLPLWRALHHLLHNRHRRLRTHPLPARTGPRPVRQSCLRVQR